MDWPPYRGLRRVHRLWVERYRSQGKTYGPREVRGAGHSLDQLLLPLYGRLRNQGGSFTFLSLLAHLQCLGARAPAPRLRQRLAEPTWRGRRRRSGGRRRAAPDRRVRDRRSRSPAARLAFHRGAQELVDPSLITASLRLQPREHVRVKTNRERFLDRPIELAHDRTAPVAHFGRVRKIDLRIAQRGDRSQFPLLLLRHLAHNPRAKSRASGEPYALQAKRTPLEKREIVYSISLCGFC